MKNIFIIIVSLLFFSSLNAKESGDEKVSIQLKWKHSFQFAGYYAAIEKGFYKEEGLEVTLKEIDFQKSSVQSVIDEESQYGVSDSTLVVYSLQDNPLVLISQIFQQSPLVLISLYESKITTPYDMIGKKISYSFNGYGGTPINAMFLNSVGGLSDIKLLPFASYEDLINKKVDVISAYSTSQPFLFAKKGVDINIIDPKSYGIDFYGDNFFTTKKELDKHPDRVIKMKKATLKGWEYALKNQDELIDIIIKKYAPKADKEILLLEARSTYQMIMPDFIKLGNINRYKYLNVAQTYHKLNLVKKSKIDDKFFYEQKAILTKEQTNWIKEAAAVKVGAGPDWAPFDFIDSKGNYNGISKDYLDLVAEKTGLKFDTVVDEWSNNLKKMKNGKIDLLHALYYTEQRTDYMNFTSPYFEMLDYFFIRDNLDVKTVNDLDGKRVAIPKGYAHEDILKKEFPLIKIVTVNTFSDAIDAVLENRADMLFDTYISLSYVLKKEGINTIIPFKSYRGHATMKLHMATDKNSTMLTSIMQKGLDAITDIEKKEIYAKWIGKNLEDIPEQISLTQAEKRWLEKNPTISFAGDPHWLPFEAFNKKGEYIGIVAEYLKELEKKIDIKIKPKVTSSWQETLDLSQKGEVDIISGDIDDEVLKQNYKPITPYSSVPIVIIMNNKNSFVNDLKDIKDKKIAIVDGYGYTHKLIENYKDIPFIQTKNPQDALSDLVYDKYDAVLLSMPAAGYLIKTKGFDTLKIVGKTSIQMKPTLFIHKDKPFLRSIVEKSMNEIKSNEKLNKWQKVEFATNVNRTLLYQLLGVFGFILLLAAIWNYKLTSEIKKREKLNEALKESEAQIKTLIDNILLYVIVTTMEGKIILANPKTIKDYNLSNEDIESYNILEFYKDANERAEVIEALQKQGVVKDKIIKLKNYNGDIDNIMVSILPIMYNRQKSLLTIGVDLTKRLKIQEELSEAKKQAELANLSKSEFLANMSHEIRTPMNSVIGFSNLLDKLITDPIQKDYLSSIKRGGSALLDIINDILDLSKIEAGKLEIVLESVSIKQLVLEMESIFSVKLIQKNLNFEIEVDDSVPKYLLLDSSRIRQILFNLIGNAIKFTDNGVIKLSVKKVFDDEKKSKVDLALIVEDSGIGIDAKNLENIFNSFEQQKGQSQKYGGTGLGLAICKKLLNFMNGSIEVESELGRGSKFTVYLKEVSVSSIGSEQKKPQLIDENIKFNSASILVVDDIKDNRKLLKSTLKDYNLNIYEAQNGKDALEKLKSIKMDLICMDIKMPVMDGYEAIQIIKNNPLLKNIPVIAITASVMGKDMQKIKEYKFDGYLRKPVSYDELILTLTKFLTYNTFKLITDKNDSSKKESYEDLPKTVKILEDVHMISLNKIKDLGDFSLIEEFALQLIDLAKMHSNTLLSTYAKELKTNCESFDIERIDFMLNSFPNLVEKLKDILKKEKA